MGTILECRGLFHRYGNNPALAGVNLTVEQGGIVGLLGPNGSGKTTLMKMAVGLVKPDAGNFFYNGNPVGSDRRAVTAYLPDANYLSKWMRVEQQVDYYGDFFADFDRDRAVGMLSRLGIGLKQKIRTLSKGNQEKLGLILTMSRRAKLYILDEPIAGVDPAARDFILDTVLSNKPEDATIFLCTHLIWDIQNILTQAVFLNYGTVVLNEPVKELCEREGKNLNDIFREVFRW